MDTTRLTTKKQEDLVLENLGLVHHLVRQLNIHPCDYDDLVSIGTIGLIKAAIGFDNKRKFSPYASKCIKNELNMYLRRQKSTIDTISLDSPLSEDDEMFSLEKILENTEEPIINVLEKNEQFEKALSIILNFLNPQERSALLHKLANSNSRDVLKLMKVSPSRLSSLSHIALSKVQKCAKYNLHYKEVYKMEVVDTSYQITFTSKHVRNFNTAFSCILQSSSNSMLLTRFKVSCRKDRIILSVPASAESFAFIAQIIQLLDEFDMSITPIKKN